MTDQQANSPFAHHLRWALHNLYDPGQLRKSSLISLLGLSASEEAADLRRLLLEAIEALKPATQVPPQAKGWRIYRSLYHRYVEQFSPREVAKALGLGIRQSRRQESEALQVLAGYLADQYDIDLKSSFEGARPVAPAVPASAAQPGPPSRKQELEWLGRSLASEAVILRDVIDAVLNTAGPLLAALRVTVDCSLPENLPRVAVQGASLRQALLNTLTGAARAVPAGKIRISASTHGQQAFVDVEPVGQPSSRGYTENLEMAHQLLALSGGSMEVVPGQAQERPFVARMILPLLEQVAVLVIDDNADTLQLFQRYLAGTRYPFIGAREPQQALTLAKELKPQIIVLDVMLPGVDGWELLGRLREDPLTHGIPVIVCTILPEEDLALALGAAMLLRKPVTRAAFLASLDRQTDLLAPERAE